MKKISACLVCFLVLFLAGCASPKNKPLAERGWIGGQYMLSKRSGLAMALKGDSGVDGYLPKALQRERKAAVRVVYLAANTPASLAGLRPGDFIVDLNDQPVISLPAFFRIIDRSQPGTRISFNVYRDGNFTNCTVQVGREKFRAGGFLTVCVPTVVHNWDLWPNPGFSLVVLGYEPNPGLRRDLGGNGRKGDVYDQEWCAFLGFLQVTRGKTVVSQEPYGG
jgi:hypothetical protein